MNIQISLTESELRVFSTRMALVNQQQEQFTKLSQELQLNRETLTAVWKSIYQKWQLVEPDQRAHIKFPDDLEIKFENGFLLCTIPDQQV